MHNKKCAPSATTKIQQKKSFARRHTRKGSLFSSSPPPNPRAHGRGFLYNTDAYSETARISPHTFFFLTYSKRKKSGRLTARVKEGVGYHSKQVLHKVKQVARGSRPRRNHDLGRLRDTHATKKSVCAHRRVCVRIQPGGGGGEPKRKAIQARTSKV